VEFDWDPAKSEATYRNRGFDFAYASRIFFGHRLETIDARADDGEVRISAIGQVGPDILTVIYTMRGSTVRLISARRGKQEGA
jgi:uncharacterized DUF497 family protein